MQVKEQYFAMGSESSTSIDLPPITVRGEYMVNVTSNIKAFDHTSEYRPLEPSKTSSFLRSIVDIGHLEQNLTTDLLNQLIFLQKGFIKVALYCIADSFHQLVLTFFNAPCFHFLSINMHSIFTLNIR